MNTLRLENINLHSSYMVGQTEENPFSFYFDTDFGLRYTISLRNRLFIHWFNIYEHRDRYIIRTAEGMLDGVQNVMPCPQQSLWGICNMWFFSVIYMLYG